MADDRVLAAARSLLARQRPLRDDLIDLAPTLAAETRCDELDALDALVLAYDGAGRDVGWIGEIALSLEPGDRRSASTATAFLSAVSIIDGAEQSILVQVLDELGLTELAGVVVRVAAGPTHRAATTDRLGTARFDGLPVTAVDLRASDDDLRSATADLLERLGAYLRDEGGSDDLAGTTIAEVAVPSLALRSSGGADDDEEDAEGDATPPARITIPQSVRMELGDAVTGSIDQRGSVVTLRLQGLRDDVTAVICAAVSGRSGSPVLVRFVADPSGTPADRIARLDWEEAIPPATIVLGLAPPVLDEPPPDLD